MANSNWKDLFPSGRCEYLRFEGSDHMPFITLLDGAKVEKRRPFRFNRRMQEKEGIQEIIEEAWQKEKSEAVADKINRCRK